MAEVGRLLALLGPVLLLASRVMSMLLTIVVNLLLRLRRVNHSAGTAGDCLSPAYADGSLAAGLPTRGGGS
jgi:hypothetical protein